MSSWSLALRNELARWVPKGRRRRYDAASPAARPFGRRLSLEPLESRRLLAALPDLLAGVDLGSAVIDSEHLVQVGATLFFVATDDAHGTELWRTDGTAEGTRLVLDIDPGPDSSSPGGLTNVDGTLFFSASEDVHGRELWKSDGTAAGTVLVADIYAGTNSSNPDQLTDVGGTLYFTAYESTNGNELRRSDGTAAGTVLVANINPGSNNSFPQQLLPINDTLYFSAIDGVHGRELWNTDGTSAGTTLVADIFVGPLSSDPQDLTDFGGSLFFTANNGSALRSPYLLSPTAVADAYLSIEGEELTVAAATGVLANDHGVNALSAVLVGGPDNGTVALNANGSFTYDPLPGFHGADTFQYRAQSGSSITNIATVTITVIEPLGPIVLRDVDDVQPAGDGLWYSLQSTRPGFLSIEASNAGSPESVRLELFGDTDFTGDPLATSTVVGGVDGFSNAPDTSSTVATPQAGGAMAPFGTYRYRVVFATGPLTSPIVTESMTSAVVGPRQLGDAQRSIRLTGLPIDQNGTYATRRLYRSNDGGQTYHLVIEINDNVTTTFTDTLSDAAVLANPLLVNAGNGNSRIDYQTEADTVGKTYYLRVTGNSNAVDLRLANLVVQDGAKVTVYGTEVDDQFRFQAGGSIHLVTIDDFQYRFNASQVTTFTYEGETWVTENVHLTGELLSTGDLADTAEILKTQVLGNAAYGQPANTTTTAFPAVPSVVSTTATAGSGGQLTPSTTYQYKIVYFDPTTASEGLPSDAVSAVLGAGQDKVTLGGLPIDGSGIYSQQRIYRNTPADVNVYYLVGTQNNAAGFVDVRSDADLQTADQQLNQALLNGTFTYYVTFVDALGVESRPSDPITVTVAGGGVQLRNLPAADVAPIHDHPSGGGWVKRRIYRNIPSIDPAQYHRVAEINNATTAGLTYTDHAADAAIATNPELDFDGPKITATTPLVDVLRRSGSTYVRPFEPGTLQLTGTKGGTTLDAKQLPITTATTVRNLLDFMVQAFGIRLAPPPGTPNPIPQSREPLPGDPNHMVDPGGAVVDGRMRLVGNNGLENAIAIPAGGLLLATSVDTHQVDLPFPSTQTAIGWGIDTDFSTFDFRNTPIPVRLILVLEARDAASTTYRWFADCGDNDPASGVSIAVGTGLVTFDAAGNFVSATNTTVSIDRHTDAPDGPFQFELDFSQLTTIAAGLPSLAAEPQGGSDTADMYDSPGNDEFLATPVYASLTGSGYSAVAKNFPLVNAYATAGGTDVAKLFDSPGNDHFIATPVFGRLYGTGFDLRVNSFDGVHAYATSGGVDEAKLFDSAGNDTFFADPTAGALFGTGFYNRAKGFEGVHAYATAGGIDTARLFDSDGDDTFFATPDSSALFGAGFYNRAKFFERVFADAAKAGNDVAELHDSALDDLLLAEGDFARLTNLDFGNNFQQASKFNLVRAYATTGVDKKDVRPPLSFTLELFGPWTDV